MRVMSFISLFAAIGAGYITLTGTPTGWSNELSKAVLAETLPSPLSLPVVPDVVIPGFILDSITYKAQ